jgi:prepilin-type N-terminal cleavage/methylation domain-containing protein
VRLKKSPPRGFTLIEVLLAVSFLALGTLMIQEGFLRCATLYGRYANTMRASVWTNEILWEAREAALFTEVPPASSEGEFEAEGVPFRWRLASSVVTGAKDLYSIKLTVEWNEGSRPQSLVREIYAAKPVLPS